MNRRSLFLAALAAPFAAFLPKRHYYALGVLFEQSKLRLISINGRLILVTEEYHGKIGSGRLVEHLAKVHGIPKVTPPSDEQNLEWSYDLHKAARKFQERGYS